MTGWDEFVCPVCETRFVCSAPSPGIPPHRAPRLLALTTRPGPMTSRFDAWGERCLGADLAGPPAPIPEIAQTRQAAS